ncbi:MAG TPA: hypothetical protein VML55_08730 [Planctomycetaceae bacterium]|nr:hypothetical protein [Planctomycetaceae bacterium]
MRFGISALVAALALILSPAALRAQAPARVGPWYQPLHHQMPPGAAAYWTPFQGKATPGWFQPVRFELPSGGNVTLYDASPAQPVPLAAPALAGLLVGHVYRLRLSDMPEFPGVELYPTVEVLDRLHPPPGREAEFPVPVPFTPDEVEQALSGGLVTKVIYLEQPQIAIARDANGLVLPVQTVSPQVNLLSVADQLGRPLLIVRLGGRLPEARNPDPAFWGTGGPVRIVTPPPPAEQP